MEVDKVERVPSKTGSASRCLGCQPGREGEGGQHREGSLCTLLGRPEVCRLFKLLLGPRCPAPPGAPSNGHGHLLLPRLSAPQLPSR